MLIDIEKDMAEKPHIAMEHQTNGTVHSTYRRMIHSTRQRSMSRCRLCVSPSRGSGVQIIGVHAQTKKFNIPHSVLAFKLDYYHPSPSPPLILFWLPTCLWLVAVYRTSRSSTSKLYCFAQYSFIAIVFLLFDP